MPAKGFVKTHCKHGHPYSGDNLRIKPNGKRECRACARAKSREWNKRHRDKYLEMHRLRARAWRLKNPEKARAAVKKWQQTDRAKMASTARTNRWRANNPEKFKAQRKAHYERNYGRIREWQRKYFAENADRIRKTKNAHYRNCNPGPEIRRIVRDLREGKLDVHAALAKIRECIAKVDGPSGGQRGPGGIQCDGDSGAGQSSIGNSSDSSQHGEGVKGI